ncbi:MAG: hypothetical protein H5U13_00705 [Parvibaculum sp.]|nr:hypothetical protein [Parvibaculum sp.]
MTPPGKCQMNQPLTEEELVRRLAEAETAYEAEIEANLKRNYVANLAHGLLGQTGFCLVNAPTFVPACIYLLSGSAFAVGLALVTAIGFLCVFGLFNGMQAVIFNTLMAKVIPLRLRGRLTGFRNFSAGLTAAGVSFTALFSLSIAVLAASVVTMVFVDEPRKRRLKG